MPHRPQKKRKEEKPPQTARQMGVRKAQRLSHLTKKAPRRVWS